METEAPVARLELIRKDGEVKIAYWSHRRKWEDIDDMGGCILPLDQALGNIASNSTFWTRTLSKNVQSSSGRTILFQLSSEINH